MQSNTVFLGLGGNIGKTIPILEKAIKLISSIPGVSEVENSPFYQTSPVSEIPQGLFVNSVCRVKTTLDPHELFSKLEEIERQLGKVPKGKSEPRPIDIDLLLFNDLIFDSEKLTIPHPKWKERLFVLVPLRELTKIVVVSTVNGKIQYNLDQMINDFENVENEVITPVANLL